MRNAMTWSKRFAYGLWYLENASLWLDLKIMASTPLAIVSARNNPQSDHATMPTLYRREKTVK